ncbi:hypothetical protein D3C87_2198530 [compost metagenome]
MVIMPETAQLIIMIKIGVRRRDDEAIEIHMFADLMDQLPGLVLAHMLNDLS